LTKKEIIDAAFRVWGRDFYFHTSLSKLASELGVCKPALYRHFLSKNALLEAMLRHFYDDYTAFILPEYEKAMKVSDKTEAIFILTRSIIEYYARNVDIFIFAMIKLHRQKADTINISDISEELRNRGVDFRAFYQSINKNYTFEPIIMRLVFTTLTFYMAGFHKAGKSINNQPSEESIQKITGVISAIIGKGLGYTIGEIDELDYIGLEKLITGKADSITDDPLLKAVAGAVAEAGPWEASMEQVAKRSGLSKSSLYCHFKSRQDMLRQLFMTESLRIIDFSRQGMLQSQNPLEQLYLGIISIAEYLRSKPDILVALDWIRNRKLNIDPDGKSHNEQEIDFLRIFDEIDIKPLQNSDSPFRETPLIEQKNIGISPWILFLIVNTLMRKNQEQAHTSSAQLRTQSSGAQPRAGKLSNEDIRMLFRFIALGIGGFKNNEE